MTVRGSTHTLTAAFFDEPGGVATDPTAGPELTIRLDGAVVHGPVVPTKDSVGLYSYDWAIPADATPGTYVAEWSATMPGETESSTGYETFEVTAEAVVTFTSVARVADRTGVTVSDLQLRQAVGVITAEVGYDLAADPLPVFRARDLRLLGEAVDWQAAYIAEHAELLTREGNLNSASTNGNALSWGEGGSAGALIAPLAAMSLKRLSWRRSRSIPMRRTRTSGGPQTLVHDGSDAEWRPLR